MKLIFATTNEGKLKEVRGYLPNIEIKSLTDFPEAEDVEETGLTYKENAFLKAESLYNQLGLPVIAEDSGIRVDWLEDKHLDKFSHKENKGMEFPGIYSARYSSVVLNNPNLNHNYFANNHLVLAELADAKKQEDRKASYISTFCYYDGVETKYFVGEMSGVIGFSEIGNNGFAYDTIFHPELEDKTISEITYAQMNNSTKNKYSHRIKSLNKIVDFLKQKA